MFFPLFDNRNLYSLVDYAVKALHPVSDLYFQYYKYYLNMAEHMHMPKPFQGKGLAKHEGYDENDFSSYQRQGIRSLAGMFYLGHMLLDTYHKPEFGIHEFKYQHEYYDIIENIIKRKDFCNLLHFKKYKFPIEQPKLLLVAPMSGHYATLLRDTVVDLLPHYDVYITDWINPRDVPLTSGSFDLNDYVQYMIGFIQLLGPDVHVMAICQATVPTLVAIAALSEQKDPHVPQTAILLGGPIDTSHSPTTVNDLAVNRGESWFTQNLISIVPESYPGRMRLVYPGFMQLSGFMSMNTDRHLESMQKAVENFSQDDADAAFKTFKFYAEYFAVMDLTAEFYMQTINTVFQEKLLTEGRYKFKGKNIKLNDITHTAIMAIEGENDDITGIGQTQSVLDHCHHLAETKKAYFVGKDVGHYGLFNGSKFRKVILPAILKFTTKH